MRQRRAGARRIGFRCACGAGTRLWPVGDHKLCWLCSGIVRACAPVRLRVTANGGNATPARPTSIAAAVIVALFGWLSNIDDLLKRFYYHLHMLPRCKGGL